MGFEGYRARGLIEFWGMEFEVYWVQGYKGSEVIIIGLLGIGF